jgi:hypothetical protein
MVTTDVFVLLLNSFESICINTNIHTFYICRHQLPRSVKCYYLKFCMPMVLFVVEVDAYIPTQHNNEYIRVLYTYATNQSTQPEFHTILVTNLLNA